MGEQRSLLKTGVAYSGIFSLPEIYTLIHDFFNSKGYEMFERLNQEVVTEKGRHANTKLFPYKQISDYTQLQIKVIIMAKDLEDITVDLDGEKKKMSKGSVRFALEAYVKTDYEGKHDNKPIYFLIREIFDRFIYRVYTDEYEKMVVGDLEQFKMTLKGYFNIQ